MFINTYIVGFLQPNMQTIQINPFILKSTLFLEHFSGVWFHHSFLVGACHKCRYKISVERSIYTDQIVVAL